MNKILLAVGVVVFAGVAATMALASDHKPAKHGSEPVNATVITPAKPAGHPKGSAPKRHHPVKRHHSAHKAHAK